MVLLAATGDCIDVCANLYVGFCIYTYARIFFSIVLARFGKPRMQA